MYSESWTRNHCINSASYTFTKNHCSQGCTDDYTDYTEYYYVYNECTEGYEEMGVTYYEHSNYTECLQYNRGSYCDNYAVCSNSTCSVEDPDVCNDDLYEENYYEQRQTYKDGYSKANGINDCCLVKWDYSNYFDRSNPNSGSPIPMTWNSSAWSGDNLKETSPKLNSSSGKQGIKDIYNNVQTLLIKKGRNNVPNSSISDFGSIANGTRMNATKNQIDSIRNTIQKLNISLGVPVNPGDFSSNVDKISKQDISSIKKSIDKIASLNMPYANYLDLGYQNAVRDDLIKELYIDASEAKPFKGDLNNSGYYSNPNREYFEKYKNTTDTSARYS